MRKKSTKPVVLAAFAAGGAKYDIAAYVWPAYQPDPRWAELGIFADGDGEWQGGYRVRHGYHSKSPQ